MSKQEGRSILGLAFSRLLGLACFLLMVWLLNYLLICIDNDLFSQAVGFLNDNVILLMAMAVIYAAGEIFSSLSFPLSLPAPILDAVASVFLAEFIFRLLSLTGKVTGEPAFKVFDGFKDPAYMIVFVAVLATGYISIFMRLAGAGRKQKKHRE